jgi:hypothetical protein
MRWAKWCWLVAVIVFSVLAVVASERRDHAAPYFIGVAIATGLAAVVAWGLAWAYKRAAHGGGSTDPRPAG